MNGTIFRKLVSFMREQEQSIIAESTDFVPPRVLVSLKYATNKQRSTSREGV